MWQPEFDLMYTSLYPCDGPYRQFKQQLLCFVVAVADKSSATATTQGLTLPTHDYTDKVSELKPLHDAFHSCRIEMQGLHRFQKHFSTSLKNYASVDLLGSRFLMWYLSVQRHRKILSLSEAPYTKLEKLAYQN